MKAVEIAVPTLEGSACARCLDRLGDSLALLKGVEQVEVRSDHGIVVIGYDPVLVPLSRLEDLAKDLGVGIASRYAHVSLTITELDCADCAAKLVKGFARSWTTSATLLAAHASLLIWESRWTGPPSASRRSNSMANPSSSWEQTPARSD